MKNQRLIILMSILAFIVVIIVFSSTVFSLKQVDINFLSTTNNLSTEETIVDSVDFNFGQNIFFVDKETYISQLEIANPYLRVVGLEIQFPNKIIVHVVERNEMYVFKLSDNTYAICDEFLKVLELSPTFINTNENALRVFNYQFSIATTDALLGTTLTFPESYINIIDNFTLATKGWDINLANIRGNINSIELAYEYNTSNNNINDLLVTTRQGLQIIVKDANIRLEDKLQVAFSVYDSGEIDITVGQIEIREELDGDITAFYPEIS